MRPYAVNVARLYHKCGKMYFLLLTPCYDKNWMAGGGRAMEEEKEFTVRDKRRFTEEADSSEGHVHAPPVEINFASFIFSLGRSAFIHLGEEPDPTTGQSQVSIPLAKETIDILSLLEEKTKGNVPPEEAQL